jgi:hypothetical protein
MAKFPLIVTGVLVVAGVTGAAIGYRRRRSQTPADMFAPRAASPTPKQFEMVSTPSHAPSLLTSAEPVSLPTSACA